MSGGTDDDTPEPSDGSTTRDLFRRFAAEAVAKLPLYRRLCEATADDREVADRILVAHPDQRVPNILLAAVHDVVLAGDAPHLADWYGSVAPHPRPVGRGDDDPWPAFRELALHDPGVDERLRTRSTQTNEVGRCALLVPVLADLAATAPGARPGEPRPLGLVEIGASAGLNLLLDRYGYRYEPIGHEVAPSSPLTLTCALRGDHLPPLPAVVPHIATRVGLDLHPVDVSDPLQARWLVACQWPDQPDRIHRARTAIALAHRDPPHVLSGDATTDLVPLIGAVPQHVLPVVVATWVLAYLDEPRRCDLIASLDDVATERDLTFVVADLPALIAGVPVPPRPDGAPERGATTLLRYDWRHGSRTVRRCADAHPHGTWMEWFDPGG